MAYLEKTVDAFIQENTDIKKLVNRAAGYHVFDNHKTESRDQVTELLKKIDTLLAKKRGYMYIKKVERAIKERIQREMEKNNKDIEKNQAEILKVTVAALKEKHGAEINDIHKRCSANERKIREDEEKKRKMVEDRCQLFSALSSFINWWTK